MKIIVEFDPGELARSAATQVGTVAPGAAAVSVPGAPYMSPGTGTGAPIDAGHAPGIGGVTAGTVTGAESVPAEIAAAAAAIGAISAGPAPDLH
jgi:hypothetical protein